ncbi:MAG: hypothetical protein H0W84_02760 [Bacteroidetes bacterium]|nr:hypothetical protein [Bacteroidota bacterium]
MGIIGGGFSGTLLMSVLKKIINWFIFIIFVFILMGVTYIIYNWSQSNTHEDILKTLPNDIGSKIAIFKPDTKQLPKIKVQRFLIKEPYKYPFYSPQYYTDYFYIHFPSADSLVYVIDEKDTVRWGDLYIIDTVPLRMKGYDLSGMLHVTYYQDTLFQSNIEHKPKVLILRQISLGPVPESCKSFLNFVEFKLSHRDITK